VAQKEPGSSQTHTATEDPSYTNHGQSAQRTKKKSRVRTILKSSVLNNRIGLLHVFIPKAVKI